MDLLVTNPILFINNVTPFQEHFVLFCAIWLPFLTIIWVLVYILIRPIPNKCVFAPFENLSVRLLQLALIVLSTIGAYVTSDVLKNYFQIARPAILEYDVHPLILLTDYGFPSSHATIFAAIAASMFLINKRAGAFATLLALIIGAARIFAGVHTPLDIIGGYILGVLFAIIVDFIAKLVESGSLEAEA